MNSALSLVNQFALCWWEALLRASWQGGLALAIVWAIVRVRPRLSPHVQCWLWRGAYLKLLLAFVWGTPLTLAVLPPSPHPLAIPERPLTAAPIAPALPIGSLSSRQKVTSRAEGRTYDPASPLTLPGSLFVLWLGLFARQAIRASAEWRRARRIYLDCRPMRDRALPEECARLTQKLGLRRMPRLMQWEGTHTPILLGSYAPIIVLSEAMQTTYSATDQKLMVAHELAHLKRRDLLWAWLPLLARALFAFHPLVWIAQQHLITAQEMACDAIALELTQAPTTDYGNLLIRIATQTGPGLRPDLPILGMVTSLSYPTLKRRILAMKTSPVLSPTRLAISGFGVLILGLATIVPWRVSAQAPPQSAGAPQTRAGRYTLQVESADTISPGSTDVVANGTHFNPNVAVHIRVQGEKPDTHFIAGFFPAALGIDAQGAQAEASPLAAPQAWLHVPAENFGQILLRLPDSSVKRLRSLEGALAVFESAETTLELSVNDFKPGVQKRIGNMTLRVNSSRTTAHALTFDLTLTRPRAGFDPAAPLQDQPLLAAVDTGATQAVRAELRDDKGQAYQPSEFGSSLTTIRQVAPTPGDPAAAIFDRAPYRQSLQITFPLPKRGSAPKTLVLYVDSYTGKYQRLPFKFTDIPLSASR